MRSVYSAQLIHKIHKHLKNGGVIAYPTESCYGFGCDPHNHKAINKIIRIKGRSKSKGLIVVASRIEQLKNIVDNAEKLDQSEFAEFWPGFFSLLLPASDKIQRNLIGNHKKIAVRISKHPLIQQICTQLNTALVSTSANQSGHISSANYRDCKHKFGKQVMVLSGTTLFAKKPSTIIDWESKKILR